MRPGAADRERKRARLGGQALESPEQKVARGGIEKHVKDKDKVRAEDMTKGHLGIQEKGQKEKIRLRRRLKVKTKADNQWRSTKQGPETKGMNDDDMMLHTTGHDMRRCKRGQAD